MILCFLQLVVEFYLVYEPKLPQVCRVKNNRLMIVEK